MSNDTDYLFKKNLYKVKTDDVNGVKIAPSDELYYTYPIVRSANVWLQSDLLSNGPVTNIAQEYTLPMFSVHTTDVYNAALTGRAWMACSDQTSITTAKTTRIGNWIDPGFNMGFTPTFYCIPSGTTPPDITSSIGTIAPDDPTYPFIFDYQSGIVTFTSSIYPQLTTLVNGYIPAYTLWVHGWVYTGTTGSVIRNIGLNSYIDSATVTSSFQNTTGVVTNQITYYGNSSIYNTVFTYPIYCGSNSNTTVVTYQDVKTSPNYQNTNQVYTVTHTLHLATYVAGTYTVNVSINTGGSGSGSTYTTSCQLQLTSLDNIRSPSFTASGLTLATDRLITIDGVSYYSNGTAVTIPAYATHFTGIYNGELSTQPTFNFWTVSSPLFSSVTYPANILSSTYGSDTFITATGSDVTYYNCSSKTPYTPYVYYLASNTITYASNVYTWTNAVITSTLTNAVGISSSGRLYPSDKLGYVYPWNSTYETNIPINTGTVSGVTTITRVSFTNNSSISGTSSLNALATVQPFSTMHNLDPVFCPLNYTFYANSSTLISYLSTCAMPTQTLSFSGTKWLVLKLANTGALPTFTLNMLGAVGVTNVYVYWVDSAHSYGWYDANVLFNLGGCGAAGPSPDNTVWQIKMNSTNLGVSGGPGYDTTGDGGNVYIAIGFNETIPMTGILVSA